MNDFVKKHYKKIVIIILLLMALVSVYGASKDTLIYDEDAHIPAGYSYLVKHDMRLNPEHPPLLKDLAAVPLLFLHLNFDTTQDFWSQDANSSQWNAGKYLLFQAGNNPDAIVFWSRIPIILLSLLLGFFIFKWAREIGDIWSGLIALTLYAFDPNILGHNHFVTTDLGIAAFIAFAFYYFLHFIKDPTWKNALWGGLFIGLMQLAKFSAVLVLPIMGLVLILYPLATTDRPDPLKNPPSKFKRVGSYLGKGLIAFVFSLLIVWIFYFFNTYKMPAEKLPEVMSYYLHPNDPRLQTIYTRKVVLAINSSAVTRPMAVYVFGVARVFQRVAGGNVTYYFGQISTQGYLSYFPVVFLLKEPISTIILILTALLIGLWIILKNSNKNFFQEIAFRFKHFLRFNILEFTLLSFIFLYLLSSITGRLNIGYRHLFPIFPLIYILAAVTLRSFWKKLNTDKQKKTFGWLIFSLIFLTIFETAVSFPYYMSYFNEFAGGPKNGYHYVTDSNADWGQDLKKLGIWIDDYNSCAQEKCNPNKKAGCSLICYSIANPFPTPNQPIEKINVDYFGMADLNYYLGNTYQPWWGAKRPLEPGWYAISTLFLQESIYSTDKKDEESYRWTKKIQPIHQVGTSIMIYYLTVQDIANLQL